jgi:hypothetical protein
MRTASPTTELETAGLPSESLATWLCRKLLLKGLAKLARESDKRGVQNHELEMKAGTDLTSAFNELRQAILSTLLEARDLRKRFELLMALDTRVAAMVGTHVCACTHTQHTLSCSHKNRRFHVVCVCIYIYILHVCEHI